MGKHNEIDEIISIYNFILENKSLDEVSSSSDKLLGGASVTIPNDGSHKGQSGWQSNNAWDIKGSIGSPVYALADGVAQTFNDYGNKVRQYDGKKLYGQSFTVKSDGGLPSIYYTHLQNSPVTKGSKIKCGQFLGYIMDFPDGNYDHVHIGVESGNISQFLNTDGTIKCAKGQIVGGDEINNASQNAYDYATGNNTNTSLGYGAIEGTPKSLQGVFEQKNFGKNISNRYGRVVIPKENNPKIKSPISGVINNGKYFSGCQNQITIENNDDDKIYLQFCGISNPKVKNGKSINIGDVLGYTDSDVEVIMYDSSWNRINIPDRDLVINKKKGQDEIEKDVKKSTEPEYYDPLMAAILGLPSRLFKDKFDKSGNRVEKRYGGVSDKKQVDPWVLNLIKDPFKRKKVDENIKRIKKIL